MKVSIITSVYNGSETIDHCIESVNLQSHRNIEHIIIDGGSNDDTLSVIRRCDQTRIRLISKPNSTIYDALNTGITMSSGRIIGILHADDFYAHNRVLGKIVAVFEQLNVDSCYGDLKYVDKHNVSKVVRYWKSSKYIPGKLKQGWMPPHPTFYVKKKIYERCGLFDTAFKRSADYELMLRFLARYRISTNYIPEVLVKMRSGGISNRGLRNILLTLNEDYKALKANKTKGALLTVIIKKLSKIPQLFKR